MRSLLLRGLLQMTLTFPVGLCLSPGEVVLLLTLVRRLSNYKWSMKRRVRSFLTKMKVIIGELAVFLINHIMQIEEFMRYVGVVKKPKFDSKA